MSPKYGRVAIWLFLWINNGISSGVHFKPPKCIIDIYKSGYCDSEKNIFLDLWRHVTSESKMAAKVFRKMTLSFQKILKNSKIYLYFKIQISRVPKTKVHHISMSFEFCAHAEIQYGGHFRAESCKIRENLKKRHFKLVYAARMGNKAFFICNQGCLF